MTLGAGTLQTTGAYTLDAGTVTLTAATAGIDTPLSTDDITLSGLVTGTGGLNKTGPGTLELANAAGNNFSGDTNVQAGTLMADTDNALSPASNLVIGDGASVVLNFGNVGGFGWAVSARRCRPWLMQHEWPQHWQSQCHPCRPASRRCPSRARWCSCSPGPWPAWWCGVEQKRCQERTVPRIMGGRETFNAEAPK